MTLTASDLPDSPSARPAGLADAEVVAIKGVSSLDFLHAAFDCTARGQVFAISRPDSDLADLVGSIRTIDLPDTAHLGWGQLSYRPDLSDAPAQIVFTSGTEGTPKPIVLSHRNLADTVARLNAIMGVTDEIREYIGVPVTYSFGLGRVRAVSAVGGRFFLPDRFDPVEIRTLLEAGEINAISAVPSLWQVVLANPDVIGDAGAAVRWGSRMAPAFEVASTGASRGGVSDVEAVTTRPSSRLDSAANTAVPSEYAPIRAAASPSPTRLRR